jgi:hypothetical protein
MRKVRLMSEVILLAMVIAFLVFLYLMTRE